MSITLPTWTSGTCETGVEYFIDDVSTSTTPRSFFGSDNGYNMWGSLTRYFTLTPPYTLVGTTTTGAVNIYFDESNYSYANSYEVKVKFYSVGHESETTSTYTQTLTFTLNLIDPRCVPNLVLPSLNASYTWYVG